MAAQDAAKGGFWRWLLGNRASDCALRYALLPIRLMTGVIFFWHGAQKAFGWFGGNGFSGVVENLSNMQFPLPTVMALLLVLAELVGGLMLIVGIVPRFAAGALAVVMVVALCTAHKGDPFVQTHSQQMLLAAAVTIFIAGVGKPAVQPSEPPPPPLALPEQEGE